MLVQTTQELRDYEGNVILQFDQSQGIMMPVLDSDGNQKSLTFRDAVGQALNSTMQGENLSPEEKTKTFNITVKLFSDATTNLDHAECVFIEERCGKLLSPLVFGRVKQILDNDGKLEIVPPEENGSSKKEKAKHA